MSCLYSRLQLKSLAFNDLQIPMQRYLHKFLNNEISSLKMHEKDFFFQNLKLLKNDQNKRCYDIRKIKEAKEYYFYSILLTYFNGSFVQFTPPCYDAHGKISADDIAKDKRFYYEYMDIWKNQVKSKLGPYYSQINIELNRKLKAILETHALGISKKEHTRIENNCWNVFFVVY